MNAVRPTFQSAPKLLRRRAAIAIGAGSAAAIGLCAVGCAVTAHVDHNGPNAPRFAPFKRRFPLALVLSSGGPRGFVHVGVIQGLAQLGIKPDLIVGSSVGALVGAMAAAGIAPNHMAELALDLSVTDLGRLNLLGEGRFAGTALADWVNDQVGQRPAQGLATAFAAIAVHQSRRQVEIFNSGDVGVAVQASAAIEGQFSPVTIRGEKYVDADHVLPMPVRLARSLGAIRVIAVDASAHEDSAPPEAARYRQGDLRKRALIAPDARDAEISLHPNFGYWVSTSRNFRERAIAAGLADTLAAAQRIKAL